MLLFRSEEHASRWYGGTMPGETMTLQQQWDLARLWYRGRDQPSWQRRTATEAQAILTDVGLVGDFWRLA